MGSMSALPPNTVKVNVDGSSLGNPGKAGFGGVIRDQDGRWICGFYGHLGMGTNLFPELQAIKHGFLLAWQKGYSSVICESDSQEALNLIHSADVRMHCYGVVISDIKVLINLQWNVELLHELREGIQVVDFMAKLGSSGNIAWKGMTDPPLDVNHLVLADAMTVAFCRE